MESSASLAINHNGHESREKSYDSLTRRSHCEQHHQEVSVWFFQSFRHAEKKGSLLVDKRFFHCFLSQCVVKHLTLLLICFCICHTETFQVIKLIVILDKGNPNKQNSV